MGDDLSSSVTLTQANPDSPVKVEGTISGLKQGEYSFRVYDTNIEEVEGQNCSTIFDVSLKKLQISSLSSI